jgi:hypothetical protein
MVDTARKATELTWTNDCALTLYLYRDCSAQHNEALIAVRMGVRVRISPTVMRIVVPDL